MPARFWADLPASEFEAVDPTRTIAVLPVAAIEQHGPHLPVGTDLHIAEGLLSRAMAACPGDIDLRVLPIQAIGKSDEHSWAAGTLTLTSTTALQCWGEIAKSVSDAGLKKIVVINSHGGNADLISILARTLRVEHKMRAVRCSWGAFGYPDALFSDQEMEHGLHGGDIETSLMLAFRPETVNMRKAKNFRSTAEITSIKPTGSIAYGWQADDLNPDGVVGEAHLATAAKGEATAHHQVQGFVQMLRDLADMPHFA